MMVEAYAYIDARTPSYFDLNGHKSIANVLVVNSKQYLYQV